MIKYIVYSIILFCFIAILFLSDQLYKTNKEIQRLDLIREEQILILGEKIFYLQVENYKLKKELKENKILKK